MRERVAHVGVRPARSAGRLARHPRCRRDVAAVDAGARPGRVRRLRRRVDPAPERRRGPDPARGRPRRPGHHHAGPDGVAGAPAACRRPGHRRHLRRRPAGLGRRDRPVDGHARRARRSDRRPLDRLHHAVVGAVPRARQPVLPRRDPHRRGTGHRSLRALEGQRIGVRHVGRQRLQRADREEPRPRRVDRVREQLLGAAHRRPRRDGGPLRHAGPGRPRRGRSAHAEDVAGAVRLDRHRRLPPAPEGAAVGRPRHRARRRRRGRPRPGHQGHVRHRDGDVPHRRLLVVRGPCRHPRRRVAAPGRRADTVHTARRAALLRPPRRRHLRRHRLDGAARLPHRVRSARRPAHARLRRRRRSGGRPGRRQRGDARRPAPGPVGGGDDGRAPGRRGQGSVHRSRPATASWAAPARPSTTPPMPTGWRRRRGRSTRRPRCSR